MNFAAVLAAARRAQAAYIDGMEQARAAFEALGHVWIGRYENDGHQAVLSRDTAGGTYLSISGTRFGRSLGDLFDDVNLVPVDVGGGARVTAGAYDGLAEMWAWAKALVPARTAFNVEGHSLGGWRALYAPLFLPDAQIGAIHAFEAPKGGNAAYWEKYAGQLASAVSTANGADVFYGYPFLGDWHHPPRNLIWLNEHGFKVITPDQWPGGMSLDDHSIDLVVARLEKIVAGTAIDLPMGKNPGTRERAGAEVSSNSKGS
ncbi:MAG: hypothetical protein JWP38_3763 [Herbaspirillum sp.]|nr:hypothetical protein [Herbaspirillum sp.]